MQEARIDMLNRPDDLAPYALREHVRADHTRRGGELAALATVTHGAGNE
jgi:hypothetical protein